MLEPRSTSCNRLNDETPDKTVVHSTHSCARAPRCSVSTHHTSRGRSKCSSSGNVINRIAVAPEVAERRPCRHWTGCSPSPERHAGRGHGRTPRLRSTVNPLIGVSIAPCAPRYQMGTPEEQQSEPRCAYCSSNRYR